MMILKRNKYLLLLVIGVLFELKGFSQSINQIPRDSAVRIGRLENGLTYYIRHNESPKQRAEFYIAQRVGSILEEEHQRGLAHFLEHMCFNGTKNFPGNSLISEFERKGLKGGENINAYTSFDETVYNLSNIPVTREGMIDTALLVLHDWSSFVLLEDKDIDDERGVIHEEWRTRNTEDNRLLETTMGNIFSGSQYAERMPIGLIEVIDHFPYQAIRDYYKKWYRPDLQAIIVVGDIDVDRVEKKIQALFADIPVPVNPATRKLYDVPDNKEPIVSIASDPEAQRTNLMVFYKKESQPASVKATTDYFKSSVIESLIGLMFNQRLDELLQGANPPFNYAGGGFGDFYIVSTKQAWSVGAEPRRSKDTEVSLRALLSENERMRRFGFTNIEFERAKANILRDYETAYNEREKRENSDYVSEYVDNFTKNEPFPKVEWEYHFVNTLLADLPLEEVNQMAKTVIADTNIVFAVTGPKKNNVILPTKEKILAIWDEVRKGNLTPYKENVEVKPLLEKKPVAGRIVKTEQRLFGYTEWTLSNGVKVLIKQTDYKKDQVILSAYSPGGLSLIKDKDLPSAMVMSNFVPLGGLGQLNRVDLGKVLTGRVARVMPTIGSISEGVNGFASPRDFETLMQLTYLNFTQPRFDLDAFHAWKSQMHVQLENASANPMNSFYDTLNRLRTNGHPRGKSFDLNMLNKVDYNRAIKLYRERFASSNDFTFFITGNVNPDSVKGFVETYLGGLPARKTKENFIDQGIYPYRGVVRNNFNRKLETPKSTVVTLYTGEIPYTLQNMVLMDYLQNILKIVYTKNIREKEGGTYGVDVEGSLNKYPKERFNFSIQFDTDPAKKEKLLGIVYDEIKSILEQAPDEEDVKKVKEFTLKSHQEERVDNRYWEGAIRSLVINGMDADTDYEKVVASVTPGMVQEFAKKVFSQGNLIEVSMNPKVQ